MLAYRVIARLDIKYPNLIKGICFEGLRVLGQPADYARKYAKEGADELLYLDTVASLYGRSQLESLIEETCQGAFIPLTVAGGIRSVEGIQQLLNAGADRVAVNSAAVKYPSFVRGATLRYGSQCLSISIEAKRVGGGWGAFTDGGRNPSGKDALQWAQEAVALGAGEILITSIDRDGTRRGPDFDLIAAIHTLQLDVPFVYSGGIRLQDVAQVAAYTDGMAIGASLHYGDCTIQQIKAELSRCGKEVREVVDLT